MVNCNNTYLKTKFELSVLQLLNATTEEIAFLQVLSDEEDQEFNQFVK
jgi:hypothetical protein